MKKVIISLFIVFSIVVLNAQTTRQDYLQKSRNQKTFAWIFTAAGAALAISGIAVSTSNTSYFPTETVGPIMLAGGAVAIAGGIVLFSASKRNEEKAGGLTIKIRMEYNDIATIRDYIKNYHPALALQIHLK